MTTNGIPAMEPLAPIVDQIREVARRELPEPRAMRIALWDDGDYDIVAYHNRGSSEREQVFYDNESGAIYWQHTKQDPDWMFPDPNDLSEGEERVVVPEYEINEVRRLSELE